MEARVALVRALVGRGLQLSSGRWTGLLGKTPKLTMREELEQEIRRAVPSFSVMGRNYSLPQSRPQRIALGIALIVLGALGFLPVLGFWMIPLGLLILSYEFARVRRLRRRFVVKWERRRQRRAEAAAARAEAAAKKTQ